jgi:heavy metal efflux system protein
MELKSLEDWVVEKNFKAVPDIVDVSSFGGPTREYQVRVDPNKLIAYGLSLAQVEQQLTNNNTNAGGSFIQEGSAADQRARVGLVDRSCRTLRDGHPDQEWHAASDEGYCRGFARSEDPAGAVCQRAIHREDGKIIDNDDVVSGIVLLRKGAAADTALQGIHEESGGTERSHFAAGREDCSLHRSQRPGSLHQPHGAAQPDGRNDPGLDHSVFVSGQYSGRADCGGDDSVFAVVRVDLSGPAAHSRQPAVARRAGFRHGGGWRGGDGGKHRPPFGTQERDDNPSRSDQRGAAHEVQRPVFYAIAIIITAYLPIFTLQRVEGRLFHPMAWTVAFALLGALLFSIVIAPVLAVLPSRKGAKRMAQPGACNFLTERYRVAVRWAIRHRGDHVWAWFWLLVAWEIISPSAAPSVRNFCLTWMKARSGCAARLRPAPGRTKASGWRTRRASYFASFPEVPQCTSQTGRPDDGTDTTGLF